MQQVELELTLAEVNQILDALSDKSYKQVYQLIIKIQQQAENQLQKNDQRQLQPENQPNGYLP
jgi:hypothetical protein